jgi:hypothetical protein
MSLKILPAEAMRSSLPIVKHMNNRLIKAGWRRREEHPGTSGSISIEAAGTIEPGIA